jgi:hypothetical protein
VPVKNLLRANVVDRDVFLVYFYTNMQLETTPSDTANLAISRQAYRALTYQKPKLVVDEAQVASTRGLASRMLQSLRHNTGQREALAEYVELLFSQLRGEALLIATLAYGLGARLSALRTVRIRDVAILDTVIVIAGREYTIPDTVHEDLREHLHDKVCGCEASTSFSRRDELVFCEEAFTHLAAVSRRVEALHAEKLHTLKGSRVPSCLDCRLRVVGWLHRKLAAKKGSVCRSALELFDKGPRIVRRKQGGVLDAYYVWRAGRAVL